MPATHGRPTWFASQTTRLVTGAMTLCLMGACRAKPLPLEARKSQTLSNPLPTSEVVDQGCPHQLDGTCESSDSAKAKDASKHQLFGATFTQLNLPEVSLTEILTSPEEYHNKEVLVSGYVQRACSRRGCWMEISPTASNGPGCRVTFKDYGFLVPTNSQGSTAKLAGEVQVTKIERALVEHYESEGGTFPVKLADGTAREVRIVATGVELTRAE